MRTWGDHQFFRQVGGWSLDYTEGQGGALDPANGAFLAWLDSLGEAALTGLEAGGVSTLLDRLRGREDLASVSVGPDMRYQPKA